MRVEFRGWSPTATSPVSEAIAASRAALARPAEPAMLLGYTPVVRGNPYQELLYRGFGDAGIVTSPITDPWKLAHYGDVVSLAPNVGIHLHWPSFVLHDVTSNYEARRVVAKIVEHLEAVREAGVRLVYTVHNVIPHDALFIDEEIHLQQAIADRADVVHVMSQATLPTMDEVLRVDHDRVVMSPHPHYKRAYPDYVTREAARLTLGVDADEIVYVLFGALKAYKGLHRVIDALDIANARSRRRRRLVVAGRPDTSEQTVRFVNQASAHPDVLIHPSRVPTEQVQYYLRAADIGLAPYARVLNSGAALLYQSFDLPVLAARSDALWEGLDPASAELDPGGSAADLAEAMIRADRLLGEATRNLVRNRMEQYDPEDLSRAFAAELLARLGAAQAGTSGASDAAAAVRARNPAGDSHDEA